MLFVLELRHRLVLTVLRVELPPRGQVVRTRPFGADRETREQPFQIVTATGGADGRRTARSNEHLELVPALLAFVIVQRHCTAPSVSSAGPGRPHGEIIA